MCRQMSPCTVHRDVTAKSNICHTLSQAVTTTVTLVMPCRRVSIHLSTCVDKLTYTVPAALGGEFRSIRITLVPSIRGRVPFNITIGHTTLPGHMPTTKVIVK